VHGLYVYPNTLVAVRVTGAQVKDVLEHTARYFDGLTCQPAGGCQLLTDATIPRYNVDSMAGLSYRIDPTRAEGDRVRDLRWDGVELDPQAVFTMVGNNYRIAGGGGAPHLAEAEVVWQSSTDMPTLIADFLDRHRPWQPRVDHNWSIAPDLTPVEAACDD
jgi:2',3'-cyclic-nucleotide 2'-phosphodiesterase/3'-nucleotidase